MSGEITNSADRFPESFNVIVKPNSKKSSYNGIDYSGRHLISIKEKAEDNKANLALIKFFKKELGLNVRIKKGLKNREKVIEKT